MKQRPILFSTPMVQAILEGRKTMTRRTIKSRHESGLFQLSRRVSDGQIMGIQSLDWDERDCEKDIICPYGKVGDVLWVRETFGYNHSVDFGKSPFVYKADENSKTSLQSEKRDSDGELIQLSNFWHPSIYMPKEAARIWLKVTNIKVERLQNITEKDAVAEGIEANSRFGEKVCMWKNYLEYDGVPSPICSFQSLWESINGKESWDNNPWVWVIEFKRIEKP